jgi:O-antigen/teichoic acid export membrane protein
MTDSSRAQRILLRGSGSSALGFLVRLGARALLLVVAARLFGPALFGGYALAVATVELLVAVAGLAMKRQVFQLLDERGDRAPGHVLLDAAILVTLAGAILGGGMALAVALLPAQSMEPNAARALMVLAPMVAGQALLDLILAATRWQHRVRYEVVGRSIVEPYAGIVAATLAWWLGFAETGLLIGYWAGTLAALAYGLLGVRRCIPRSSDRYRLAPERLRAMLSATWASTANDGLSALFIRLDLYLVGALLGEAAAGVYGMARQLVIPIRQVRQSFDGMLAPLVARTLRSRGDAETGTAIASAARLILVLQLPMMIAIVAIGEPLLGWFGPAFAAGYGALILLGAAECIQSAFGIGELFFVYRRPTLGLRITAAGIAVGLVSGLLLIPTWGLAGAGAAVLLTYGVRALLRRAALASEFGVRMPIRYILVPIAAAVAAIAVGLGASASEGPGAAGPFIALALALAAYAAALLAWLRVTGESLALVSFATE